MNLSVQQGEALPHVAAGLVVPSFFHRSLLWLGLVGLCSLFYMGAATRCHRVGWERTASWRQLHQLERKQADLRRREAQLRHMLADYEQAMGEGRGCHRGWLRLRLELLTVQDQLASSAGERTLLLRERQRLVSSLGTRP